MKDERRAELLGMRDRIDLLLERIRVDQALYFVCEGALSGEAVLPQGTNGLDLLIYANNALETHLQALCDAWGRAETLYREIAKKE